LTINEFECLFLKETLENKFREEILNFR